MRITPVLAFVGLASLCACAARGKQYMAGEAAPESAAFPAVTASAESGDELAGYEAELGRYEDSLRAEGVALARLGDAEEDATVIDTPAGGEAPADDDARDEGVESETKAGRYRAPGTARSARPDAGAGGLRGKDRCQRICDLAHATCGLADRICELAGRHGGEVRYAEACTRAEDDCRVATDACRSCAP